MVCYYIDKYNKNYGKFIQVVIRCVIINIIEDFMLNIARRGINCETI